MHSHARTSAKTDATLFYVAVVFVLFLSPEIARRSSQKKLNRDFFRNHRETFRAYPLVERQERFELRDAANDAKIKKEIKVTRQARQNESDSGVLTIERFNIAKAVRFSCCAVAM